MASTIKLKNGSGAPTTGDLVQGEPALDLTNKRLYTENASGVVIEVGTNPTALTIGGTALTATATELNVLDGITATTAELNYTDGVTSNIQTQLNTKAPIDGATFTGTTTIPTADINGGTIDGTVIGGSTAAAGSFTTLTTSSTVTHNGGTANGVAYLNGSKVLTTGSALTFDGSTLGVTSFASNSAAAGVTNTDTLNGNGLFLRGGGSNSGKYTLLAQNAAGATNLKVDNNGDISFYEDTGTTPKFFWDASAESLGIGTSSPSSFNTGGNKLVVGSGDNFQGMSIYSALEGNIYFADGTSGAQTYAGVLGYNHSSDFLYMYTDGAERMRIDSSGNVGIGTSAPASYGANANNLVVYEAGNGGITIANGTSNEGALYFADGTSGLDVARGSVYYSHVTNHMGFGTDGTERARIDSSGNLLIGTSTAGASKLVVNDDSIQVNTAKTPASASDTGTTGEIAWDANYVYICVATNTWKRSALSTW